MHLIQTYLHQGWMISEAALVLAHGNNNENSGYLLTLSDPGGRYIREAFVTRSMDVDDLLARERVPMAL
jgi:carotenoid cleavage dioxygenase-like enzyme